MLEIALKCFNTTKTWKDILLTCRAVQVQEKITACYLLPVAKNKSTEDLFARKLLVRAEISVKVNLFFSFLGV